MKKIILSFGIMVLIALQVQAQFTVPVLPYFADALEPYIDKQTMEIHHDKHHAAYVKKLNEEVTANPSLKDKSVEEIVMHVSKYNKAVRDNAGGHYNHSLFWTVMGTEGHTLSGPLLEDINSTFGSFDKFKTTFSDSAKTRFGSGWAWLIVEGGKLKITTTPNQDNPLMDVVKVKGTPILALDVWEHAYYLKYQNKRLDYITAFWNVVNWNEVNKRYNEAKKKK